MAPPPAPAPDSDLDGLTDDFEMSKGTDPLRPDDDLDDAADSA